MKCKLLLLFFLLFGYQDFVSSSEEPITREMESKLSRLQSEVRQLKISQTTTETKVSQLQEILSRNGLALVLFAIFCAWWAKTTGRSSLLWFFLGLLFHVITGIAILIKTERNR